MTRSHSRSTSPHDEHRKRGRVACVTCRQAKVRCDLLTIPCPRCERLNIDCTVDRTYKRTNKRDKVHELEDSIHRLQHLVESRQDEEHDSSPKSYAPPTANNHLDPRSVNQHGQSYPSSNHTGQESSDVTSPGIINTVSSADGRSLGSVTLTYHQIDRLYQIYLERYHPTLPILNASKTPIDLFSTSSVLFWTVMCVAARNYQEDTTLLTRLMPLLNTHMWTDFGANTKSVVSAEAWNISEIQAVLLLAAWPLPNSRFWSDRSLIMSNIAITCGMHGGLHRPGYELDYIREPPQELNATIMLERTSVWIAAYSLCVNLSCEYGHVPLVPQIDWTIKKVCKRKPEIDIPKDLRHFAIIEWHANEAFTTFFQMSENPANVVNESSFFPKLSTFEKKFCEIGEAYLEEMSLCNKICFHGTMLLLQSMYFLADQSIPDSKEGVLRALETATIVLNTLILDDTTNDFLPHAPQLVLRAILRASFVLMRVTFCSYSNSVDKAANKTLFNTAVLLVRQMSIRPKDNDQPARVANALKLSWKRIENDAANSRPPTLFIRSRLGASLTYDCLVYYREFVKAHNARPWLDMKNDKNDVATNTINQPVSQPDDNADFSLPAYTPGSDDLAGASFEEFLDGDLTWLDSLVYPNFYS